MLQVVKEIEDKGFFIRLNTIPNPEDAFANDIIYHQSCWIQKQPEPLKMKERSMKIIMTRQSKIRYRNYQHREV